MSQSGTTADDFRAAISMATQGNVVGATVVRGSERVQSPRPGGPRHPIRCMQGPFEESIGEATSPANTTAQDRFNKLQPRSRRQRLLDTGTTNGTYNEQWRSHGHGSSFHPLTKIISQIAFGVHLLHQQLAKSDEEVVKILQKHVDDVDNFVQRGEEDLDIAIADVRERIDYLKLPLEHPNVFDVMLDDKAFRTQIVQGNEKIEVVVNRTASQVKDLQVDIQKGVEATIEMGKYLDEISDDWPQDDRGSIEIFRTMQANVEGWVQCMGTLQMKGNGLSVAVAQLGSILSEMAKRAASASRREQRRANRASNAGSRSGASSDRSQKPSSSSMKPASRRQSHKPLPHDPDIVVKAVEATLPGAKLPQRQQSRSQRRYDRPREAPQPRKGEAAPSIKSTRSAKSSKSTKSSREHKPPPIHVDKMPLLSKADIARSDATTKKSKIMELASVLRFGMSSSTTSTPLASPSLPPPGLQASPALTSQISPVVSAPKSPTVLRKPVAVTHVEADSNILYELDNEAQATLIEARSKLRREQSQDVLSSSSTRLHSPAPSSTGTDNMTTPKTIILAHSPQASIAEAPDSAYASSSDVDAPRPSTSPNPRPPNSLGIFPSTSMTSLPSSLSQVDTDARSEKGSIFTALPPVFRSQTTTADPHAARAPSKLRNGTVPNVSGGFASLRKKTSLQALKKFFTRGLSSEKVPQIKEEGGMSLSEKEAKKRKYASGNVAALRSNPVGGDHDGRGKENEAPPVPSVPAVELPG